MNKTLFSYEMKKSVRMLLIFAAILAMYVICMVWMYDPKMMKSLEQMYESMPQVMAAVGMKQTSATMIGFLISYLYGFILLVFPMVFIILRAKNLIADKVEKKSMAGLLAAPVRRQSIVRTGIAVLLLGILVLVAFATVLEIVFSEMWFPGELDIKALLSINAGLLALHYFIGGLCILCSVSFNDAGRAVGVSGGISAVMFLMQMIRNTGISDDLDNLKYTTFFTLFDPNGIPDGKTSAYAGIAVLAAAGTMLYVLSVAVFSRRDLSL